MTELYWLSRLDSINGILAISAFIVFILIILCIYSKHWCLSNDITKESLYDAEDKFFYSWSKKTKLMIVIFILCISLKAFIPTTKQAYIIYGVGSTIDYVKKDSTAKQLPHKAIIALDKYLEEINNEE